MEDRLKFKKREPLRKHRSANSSKLKDAIQFNTDPCFLASAFKDASEEASPKVKRKKSVRFSRRRSVQDTETNSPVLVRPKKKKRRKVNSVRSENKKSKSKSEQFPIKICLPSGKQAVLRGKRKLTVGEFTVYCIQKLKQYDVKEDYVLCTEDGELFNSKVLLFECPYIVQCIEGDNIIPILCLCPSVASRNSVMLSSREANQEEIDNLVKDFQATFLLPGGQTITDQICSTSSVEEVKTNLCKIATKEKNAVLLAPSAYDLQIYRTPEVLKSNQIIGEVKHIIKCRIHSTIPKLVLVPKVYDPYTSKERKNEFEITSLVGRITNVAVSDPAEAYNFRATMARLRYLERKRKRESIMQIRDDLVRSVWLAEKGTPFSASSLMVSVTFPLITFRKTILLQENQTADECLEKMYLKYYAKEHPEKKASDFVFKAAGIREFICGPYPFSDFEYIRKKYMKHEKIELVMCEREGISIPPQDDLSETFDAEWIQGGEEMLDACNIQYRHEDVCTENTTWDLKTHISLWEMSENFRVKLIGIQNISSYCQNFAKALESNFGLVVTAGLYHGGELLPGTLQVSDRISIQANAKWNSWFEFPILMHNIPRACRICFTLYATKSKYAFSKFSSQKLHTRAKLIEDLKTDLPIGWVNCQLIQYNHELRTGHVSLLMWPDEKANPIGTCVPNFVQQAPSLHIQFDEYQLPVILPTKRSPQQSENIDSSNQPEHVAPLMQQDLDEIFLKDPLYVLSPATKQFIWKHREYCKTKPHSLPKLLMSVPWDHRSCVLEMHRLLQGWEPLPPLDALQMLDSRFQDAKVRQFAVNCLEAFRDADLQLYLLQLVQVLKYEPYHDSSLARFLMRRALRCQRVGHVFFWFLKAEIHVPEISERYGLLLEAYLYGCGTGYLGELSKQNEILLGLESVAEHIKTVPTTERREILIEKLKEIQLPDRFQLPIDPTWEAKGFIYEKCKYMDSKKLPLWLEMTNADPTASPIVVIFKSGDDLRQDMLTLQIIRVMDKLWKREGLDLQLNPYGCISTGDEVGMIEVVLNSATTAAITKEAGGAAAAFKKSPIANWLSQFNRGGEYQKAVDRFKLSCAGYCVATYVLGIGDRHNDNIMVQQNGRLFHIDFGHFLGNFKKKFGISRERAKFVFTPDFAYVLGGVGSDLFRDFVSLCCQAYNILRKNAGNFINLLAMMLSTGIPELQKSTDIDYLRESLCLDLGDDEAADSFCKQISASLGCKTTIINNMIHILAH